ncbi:PIN domain-containing protein [Patescibacteria group bacterium]|nr:PIN domain-containing protein [Patescibacteria group bacterium]MBU1473065.1 PIN domain-containing protein [Patescibacteria group bacterium]MBU2460179.1 PIN domain-containing protein [Patescibacteria group bacterium]MBU2544495.1 PIN domain-containing protein [Patescibacteria group bacterium]
MKTTQAVLLDTNVILRFFREDHPEHFRRVKNLFQQAEKGMIFCYIDPVVFAEVVWTLASFYKVNRSEITTKLETLLAQKWMVNEHKQTLLSALYQYQETNLDYIDCWLLAVSEEYAIPIETFDKKLQKLVHAL